MIASQKIGKSFMGALSYNMRKLNHPDRNMRAELLDMNFASLDRHLIKKEVDWIRSMKPNLGKYVYHISLNFSKEEEQKLDNEKLTAIAHEYLKGMGFTNNQFLIFRHYDADHPHIHLLVNRITFDGEVVSDSNNYKRSETLLRKLERKYGLTEVLGSKESTQRAAVKDELEMVVRTGTPSHKMVLQEMLGKLLDKPNLSLQEFITRGEELGISFMFNQASTGRVSGITYFYDGFKIKGQALGNRFKWSELIKLVNYEQDRDRKAVSEGNERTRTAKELQAAGGAGMEHRTGTESKRNGLSNTRGGGLVVAANASRDVEDNAGLAGNERGNDSSSAIASGAAYETGGSDSEAAQRSMGTDQDAHLSDSYTAGHEHDDIGDNHRIEINISEDVDDEAIHGRNRRRQRKVRTNRR